ncbi:hypothetical protein [Chloroflexus sp.]|nr:hypothetical protein [Chloroflexus sp.]
MDHATQGIDVAPMEVDNRLGNPRHPRNGDLGTTKWTTMAGGSPAG